MKFEKAVIIRDKTRLEQLIERFNSKAQAKFYIESGGGDFDVYETEHHIFYKALNQLQHTISNALKVKVLDRSFLPTYLFSDTDLVAVIGQDGLVANAAKYVDGLPMLAINPDPDTYDGVLLPFDISSAHHGLNAMTKEAYRSQSITMAQAVMNDGQRLLAFNDFYIGAASHVSSRYSITFGGQTENQSSSGIIVSTGAGSTGWLSSVFNMAQNIYGESKVPNMSGARMKWDTNQLIFVVREPFLSHMTQTGIGFGRITAGSKLTLESKMPVNGVLFSDGIESDYLNFNSGSKVEIGLADEQANLVMNN